MDLYLIVEPDNGHVDLGAAPRMFEIGEIVPPAMPELKGVMPILYAIEHPEQQVPVIQAIASKDFEAGRPPRACALLETQASAGDLMASLRSTIALARESEGYSVFRFYDPRVFRHLPWVLQPEQLSALFGPVNRWRYLDNNQGWATVERPLEPVLPFKPTAEQRATLTRLHLIEKALKSIGEAGEATDHRTARQLDSLFEKGARYSLTDEDLAVFVVQGALVSPHFDRHPKVIAALQRSASSSYAEVTTQWSDEEWAQIFHDTQSYV
ncbi:hypothetical protein R8871_05642 [Paraburkholderia graminis C4D1M]|uniref:DUF4123 domain-containing protein n=1 Tax=Paraburkholderia graminis (strain ATCC 700544 / DSM 17151 / LMG 18924 / NCIMB 13744 / C4D1M) TaxID=396598 RepID=B1G3S0_PARG4|nr:MULTISPECIES: DUF4123 domain-containing protein [Paraburkholderia]AXE90939.1 DUF4123 domain-containing protein [Paraburkholderia terricola]EDT09292.1 conserved hypothetical protein [Paraburkholderia graminis C4D1M]CAB3730005.1 hypothetical protein R8871_05642 [Paraburkholderia graminis C4D1M]